MNNEDFPRDSRALGFDLIPRHPRPGDRSRRADDKYLFLEALVSARERLYLSYVGRSVEDNAPIPPSVLVSEVLDYLRDGFGVNRDEVVTEHRLQPFSDAYFSVKGKLFSYSRENLEAALANRAPVEGPPPFIAGGLEVPGDEARLVDVDSLTGFFRNPSRFLLRGRLGLYLDDGPLVPEDRENFDLDGLERFLIARDLVEGGLSGRDTGDYLAIQRAEGRLPPGIMGDAVFGEMQSDADGMISMVQRLTKEHDDDGMEIDLRVADFFISGRLQGVTANGLVHFRPGKATGAQQLDTWVKHLIFCLLVESGEPVQKGASYLVCRDKTWAFDAAAGSREILEALLQRYWEGLTHPLPFFPESSLAYAEETIVKGKALDAALKAAHRQWFPNRFKKGLSESENPYYDVCFRASSGGPGPFDETFGLLAEEIYGPLLGHRREIGPLE